MNSSLSDKILDVATVVFSKQGYRLTDVQEIADTLKVGKGTIYRAFKSKRKLFTSIIERGMQRLLAEVHARIEGVTSPLERLKRAIQTHLDFFSRNMGLVELFIQERSEFRDHFKPLYLKYYRQHQKRIEKVIEECINQKLIKPIDPKGFTNLLTDLYYGVLFTAYLGAKRNLNEKGKYIMDVFIGNMIRRK